MASITFLWDEQKTKKLFKPHLLLFTIGSGLATIYAFFLSTNSPFQLIIIVTLLIFHLTCYIYLILLNRPHAGYRFLLFILQSQLMVAIFMAITGGFLGIVQFAPFMLLIFTVFELGLESALIVGIFTLITFLAILIIGIMYPQINALQNFFYYVGSYILILVLEGGIGRELSLQFDAKKELEQIDAMKNQFMNLASYYLRPPLSGIEEHITRLSNTMLSIEQKNDLETIDSHAKELGIFIDEILLIASVEKGQARIEKTPTDLSGALFLTVSEQQGFANRRGIKINYTPQQILPQILLDKESLHRTVSSLISNVIRYSLPSGIMTIVLRKDGDFADIAVSNTGIKMTEEQLQVLFVPFQKWDVEKAIVQEKPGLALSLYLAQLVALAHNGSLLVESTQEKGLEVTIKLPLHAS